MSFFVPQDPHMTIFQKSAVYAPMTPHSQITSYFDKFDKNYQTLSNSRNLSQILTEIKSNTQKIMRGKSMSTSYHHSKPIATQTQMHTESKENSRPKNYLQNEGDSLVLQKYAEKYAKNKTINNENVYINVDQLLKKTPETDKNVKIARPKTGKSCSTHLLCPNKLNSYENFHSPNYKASQRNAIQNNYQNQTNNMVSLKTANSSYRTNESENKSGGVIYNIYSQNNLESREKVNTISSVMRKMESLQKNVECQFFYKSMDYSQKIAEELTDNSDTTQILREAKDANNTPKQTSLFYKKSVSCNQEDMKSFKARQKTHQPFFEKENLVRSDEKNYKSHHYFSKINEKIYSQIVNKRLENGKEKNGNFETTNVLIKALGMDSPSKPSSSLNCFKIDSKYNKFSIHSSSSDQINFPTKFDKNSLKNKGKNSAKNFSYNPKICTSISNNLTVEDFQIGKCLGKGRFGSVFLAKDKRTQILVALKVIKKKMIKDAKMANQIKNEIKIQSCLSHPNVLTFYGFFQDSEQFYLILEYAPHGELYKRLKKQPNKRFEEGVAAKYVKQVLEGVLYLHSMNVIHRDIKPENILISFDILKLSDFGWATYAPSCKRQTFCGTLDYVSPEIVGGNEYCEKVDVWSLGILCYELCTGKPPFEKPSNVETFNSILSGKYQTPEFFSDEIKDFLKKILIREQDKRPDLNDLLTHPWIVRNCFANKKENLPVYSKLKNL